MDALHAEGSTLINQPAGDVFEFLCNPHVDPAELTPFEDRVTERSETPGVGAVLRTTVELAARKLDCLARCVEFEPPHKLAMRLEGDLEGTQTWRLSPEGEGTVVQLDIRIVAPEWLPAYLRNERTASRWAQTLVDQTLANVKTALDPA
ncbi:MAG: SRPBCC family protein [Anaerolineae bacterium]